MDPISDPKNIKIDVRCLIIDEEFAVGSQTPHLNKVQKL